MIRFAAEETELLRRTIVEAKMSAIVRGSTVSDDDPIPLAYRQVAKYEDDFWVTPGRAGEAAADAPPDADYVLVRRPIFTKFEPTVTAQRPWGYLMPPQLAKVVPKLLEHSITVQRLSEPLTVEVETYYASSVTPRSYFQGHEMKRATAEARTNDVTFPAGSFFVPAGQPRSNLLCQLLEPTTEDSLVSWNFLDDWVRMSGQRSGNNDPPAEYNGFGDDDRQEQTGGQVQAQQQGERQGRGGRRGGRGGGGGGQMIPIHRLMQPAQIMGVIVEPFNTFESNRYIRWR
jgi:hypothetical protein